MLLNEREGEVLAQLKSPFHAAEELVKAFLEPGK
jgi:hypothetical protein